MLPILIVDDSDEDMFLAERIIRQAKVLNPVHLMRGAEPCLKWFEEPPEDAQPALVLLDLVMFPKNGLGVLQRLHRNVLFTQSLKVMLTGLADVRYIQQGYKAGATTFLIKPFTLDDFVSFVSAFSEHFVIQETPGGNYLHWGKRRRDTDSLDALPSPISGRIAKIQESHPEQN